MTVKERDLSVRFQLGRETPEQTAAHVAEQLRLTMQQKAEKRVGNLSVYFSEAVHQEPAVKTPVSAPDYVQFSHGVEPIAVATPVEDPEHAVFLTPSAS